MRPFEYTEPQSMDEAVSLLTADPEADARVISGGTDLLSEMKDGTASPGILVSLSQVPGLQGISETGDGLSIGAMTTIAEIAGHPVVRSKYGALGEAASGIATPQIRNVGTLGGNLCQRPRCWYYRHPLVPCLKKGGDRCYALAGHSKYLCVVGGERCYIVHPSDTAVALAALDADIEIAGPAGARRLPIEQFFIGPGEDITRENILVSGEIVTRVHISTPPPGMRSLYLKAGEREAGDFALASAAVALTIRDNAVQDASVALGGVAPVPYRAAQVEEYVKGRPISEIDPVRAGRMALAGATPMADNGYKVVLASNLVKQAISRLL